jgi:hypothetical protein
MALYAKEVVVVVVVVVAAVVVCARGERRGVLRHATSPLAISHLLFFIPHFFFNFEFDSYFFSLLHK